MKSYTYEKLCVRKLSQIRLQRDLIVQNSLQNFFIITENITFTTCEDVRAHDHSN